MSTLTIKKIEMGKKGKSVKLTFSQLLSPKGGGEPFMKDTVETVYQEPNDDFVNAFIKLAPHAMYISQLIPTLAVEADGFINNFLFTDEPSFTGINVVSVELSGKELREVAFKLSKTNDKKETFTFSPSKVHMDDESEKAYANMGLMEDHVSDVFKQAEKFYNGAYKASMQAKLPL